MLKAELTTIPTLSGAIGAWQGYGTRLAVRAARLMREGVDSFGDPDAAAPHRTLERVHDALRGTRRPAAVTIQE